MIILENEVLTLTISEHGAEMKSLRAHNKEYLWNADAAYWGRSAPVLFPFVGSVKNKEYRIGDTSYPMGQHGFARDMEFAVKEATKTSCLLVLTSNEETMARYPFAFALEIGYALDGAKVTVSWSVTNTGDQILPFSIGGHPAFLCKMGKSSFHLYSNDLQVESFDYHKINADGTIKRATEHMDTAGGILSITNELFLEDALVIERSDIDEVILADEAGHEYLDVEFSTPVLGLWSPAGKNAPFVCIEPWYGRADAEDYTGELCEREYGNLIGAGENFTRSFQITIME